MPEIPALPRLPTDNLYKFAALIGAILFIIGWFAPSIALTRAKAMVRDGQRDFALLELQRGSDSLGIEILAIQERSDTSARFARRLDSLRLREDSTRRQAIMLKAQVEAASEFSDSLGGYVWLGAFLSAFGFTAGIWGFWNWYYKLQKPLDDWVKKQGGSPQPPT